MQAWKGHRLLIDALGALRANPRWVCWIAGGAQRPAEVAYEREMRARVGGLGLEGRVKFLGQRSDVPSLMAAADVFCQPNLGPEPFGIAFVEALAAGLPVVATAMGGAPKSSTRRAVGSCHPTLAPSPRRSSQLIDDDERRAALARGGPARARMLCDPRERADAISRELARLARGRPSSGAKARARGRGAP